MGRSRRQEREEARLLFLSGEVSSNAAIARRVQAKPHTIARWRQEEAWDELKLKADRHAAEKLAEHLASDRAELNGRHFRLWEALLSRAVSMLREDGGHTAKALEQISNIVARAQQGQRLAKEIATVAEAEQQARMQAATDLRTFVDLFISAVKEHVRDEDTRDRLRSAILRGLPEDALAGAGKPDESGVH